MVKFRQMLVKVKILVKLLDYLLGVPAIKLVGRFLLGR